MLDVPRRWMRKNVSYIRACNYFSPYQMVSIPRSSIQIAGRKFYMRRMEKVWKIPRRGLIHAAATNNFNCASLFFRLQWRRQKPCNLKQMLGVHFNLLREFVSPFSARSYQLANKLMNRRHHHYLQGSVLPNKNICEMAFNGIAFHEFAILDTPTGNWFNKIEAA